MTYTLDHTITKKPVENTTNFYYSDEYLDEEEDYFFNDVVDA